jgi:Gnt-I system high-affinity gluconate transporter
MNIWIPVCLALLCLVISISVFKIQPFIAFVVVSIILGLSLHIGIEQCMAAIQKGMGETSGSILPILIPGAMIGKLISKSGVASVLSDWLVNRMGSKRLPFALMWIGFIVGLPLFFSVAFLLLVPVVLAVAQKFKLQAVYLGIPLLASLSITQGYLPPHPAPYYLVTHLRGADMGITLGLGIVIAVPAMLISGLWFGKTLKNIPSQPLNFIQHEATTDKPSIGISLMVLLLPVLLIASNSFSKSFLTPGSFTEQLLRLTGEPIVALLLSLTVAVYFLAIKRNIGRSQTQQWLLEAVKEVAPLILTFAGAGAFKQILQEIKVGEATMELFNGGNMNPLIYAWIIAALLRIVTGSSTVAGITTAGLIAPLLASHMVNPNLLVLSIGAGSMVLSHVNDTGFWLYREYFGVSMKNTLRSWTMMETLIAVTGLAGVLLLQYFFY